MAIDGNHLRSWNGSKEKAFEELCCQLARLEALPSDSRFFRKGTPDAGVECFWCLPNGDEWAWQAKFFQSSPGHTQWQETDASVLQAIQKHPRLTKYTICWPIDRPDARVSNQTSCLEKWGEHKARWQQLASEKGMSVEFEFWGQSEIGHKLIEEANRGRSRFWFTDECLSSAWFASRVDEAVANARDRYTPELNIDLPIRDNFDALGRTPRFFQHLEQLYSEITIKCAHLRPPTGTESLIEKYKELQKKTADSVIRNYTLDNDQSNICCRENHKPNSLGNAPLLVG